MYDKFVPFTILFLALLKFRCFFSLSLYILYYTLCFILYGCLCILCFCLFCFLLFFQSFNPCLIFCSFNERQLFVSFWSSSCQTAIYTFCFLYMKTFPLHKFLFTMTRVIIHRFYFLLHIHGVCPRGSKTYISIYPDLIICAVPVHSFTQLFTSRTYVEKSSNPLQLFCKSSQFHTYTHTTAYHIMFS